MPALSGLLLFHAVMAAGIGKRILAITIKALGPVFGVHRKARKKGAEGFHTAEDMDIRDMQDIAAPLRGEAI
jgi:hypothetical protein